MHASPELGSLVERVETDLVPPRGAAGIASVHPNEPVVVRHLPSPWTVVGTGNYAAALAHPDYPDVVVKIYAPGRPGLEEEIEVYRRLGDHPSYSRLFHAGSGYLVLRRLHGTTFFEAVRRGIRIPPTSIADIDAALDYARERGLYPHDVHAKNVMLDAEGRGLVIDVSDFGHATACTRWDDLKRAYFRIYAPLLSRRPIPIPLFVLEAIRRGYRLWKRLRGHDG